MVFDKSSLKQLLAGGLTGCCAKFAIAPLDRTKILLQVAHPNYKNYGVFQCMFQIYKQEGITSLWKGTTMMMIRVFPYSAVQFYVFEKTKNFCESMFGHQHLNSFIAGASGGMCSVLVTYPLDLMRARLAFQITGNHRYNGIFDAFKTIYIEEGGTRAFYRGITPTLLGIIPYGGVSFFSYTTLKENLLTMFPNVVGQPDPKVEDVLVLKLWSSILVGGFAGAMSQTVSYPLDVARRRMQLSQVLKNPGDYKSLGTTLLHVYNKHGIVKGIYRGLSINYIRVIPQQAIAYSVYEILRQQLGLNRKT